MPSPNPGGRPRQHREAVAFLREHMPEMVEAAIDIVRRGAEGRLTKSDRILSQHLEFLWQAAFGKHPQAISLSGGLDMGSTGTEAGETSALILMARGSDDKRALDMLRTEMQRVEARIAQEKREHEAGLVAAAAAMARGEPVDGLTRLLLHAKAASAKRESATPPTRPESQADFYADSSGTIIDAAPAASVESAPLAAAANPAPSAQNCAPSAANPFQVEPDPPPKAAPTRSAPAKPAHRC